MKRKALLLGCGHNHDKRMSFGPSTVEGQDWGDGSPGESFKNYDLTLHDHDLNVDAHSRHNLNILPYPWADEEFDEIHAYEVLEHCGSQGDAEFFFGQFNELYRILKPGGYLCLTVPMWNSEEAWAAPDHKRVLPPTAFSFLTERYYENVGKPMYGDYRHLLKEHYWEPLGKSETETHLHVVLHKPSK